MDKHADYWRVKSAVHARGEAQARAQLASLVAQTTAEQFRVADAALAKTMTDAGLDPKANYTLENADESITLKPAPPHAPTMVND